MKSLLTTIFTLVSVISLDAEPAKGMGAHGYMLPKTTFRDVLEIVANISNKQIVATAEEDLAIQTSLVLPGPVSFENARKVISSLLILEGYELVEKGEELHLQRILTKAQCDALNQALERPRPDSAQPLPRQRARGGIAEATKPGVVVRPVEK